MVDDIHVRPSHLQYARGAPLANFAAALCVQESIDYTCQVHQLLTIHARFSESHQRAEAVLILRARS
jgi:hypothetical protein